MGPAQISTDGGATWLLIGRVVGPATDTSPGGTPAGGTVLRSSAYGGAINTGAGRIIRIIPSSPAPKRTDAAICMNVPFSAALFKDFLPPPGSKVLWSMSMREDPKPLPPAYVPRDGDVLTLVAETSAIPKSRISAYAQDASKYYEDTALARLRASGRHPVTGMLTITARLPAGEHPSSVAFLVDGETRGIMNSAPFTMTWNTRDWPDGEHLIEVDALDEHGRVTSRSKTLIVVRNRPSE